MISEPKKATMQTVEINDRQSEVTSVKEGVTLQPSKKSTRDKYHKLWLPDKSLHFGDVVLAVKSSQEQLTEAEATTPLKELESLSKSSLKARQQLLHDRIQVTQAVLPDKIYKTKKMTFKEASRMVIARQRCNLKVSDDVSEYLEKMKAEGVTDVASAVAGVSEVASPSYSIANLVSGLRRKYDTQLSSNPSADRHGSIPLHKWCQVVKEKQGR